MVGAVMLDAYRRLTDLLDAHGATYRVIEHEAEGVTEAVSRLRGHDPNQAAKCIVVMVKVAKRETRYLAAVLPGDMRIDFGKIKALLNGSYAAFASREIAEELAGSPVGTIPPFSFDERLELVFDPSLLRHPEIFFNAARLDRTIAVATADYLAIARPRVESIVAEVA